MVMMIVIQANKIISWIKKEVDRQDPSERGRDTIKTFINSRDVSFCRHNLTLVKNQLSVVFTRTVAASPLSNDVNYVGLVVKMHLPSPSTCPPEQKQLVSTSNAVNWLSKRAHFQLLPKRDTMFDTHLRSSKHNIHFPIAGDYLDLFTMRCTFR